jgi:hypothetical protein
MRDKDSPTTGESGGSLDDRGGAGALGPASRGGRPVNRPQSASAEQAYGGRPKGGPATDAASGQAADNEPGAFWPVSPTTIDADPAPRPAPTMPADVVAALIPFMQRVELTGDESYAYVRAMTYLRSQKELHQKLKQATE